MSALQWLKPTPEQIAQANEMAARIGEKPYWVGDVLFVGQPEPEQPDLEPPEPVDERKASLLAAGFSEEQATAILIALG